MSSVETPVIELINVHKDYLLGDQNIGAINGVSLKINRGEFVAIIGKSGSGKSTLMHIMGLLDTPTKGEVKINGQNVETLSENKLAQIRNKEIGFVFQAYNLLARTNVLENILLPLQYSKIPKSEWKEKAEKIINIVGLEDRKMNKSNELSGGQKQRVAIARALINDPSIILADEPTGNLDSKTGAEIENLFKALNEKGVTVVLVTHDSELARIAKRQITISDGNIIEDSNV